MHYEIFDLHILNSDISMKTMTVFQLKSMWLVSNNSAFIFWRKKKKIDVVECIDFLNKLQEK